jgi:Zn-dependent protease with chaperone function
MQINPEKIARYEKEAAQYPRWYRFRIAVIAILGDAAITFVWMLPITLAVGAQFLLYPDWYHGAGGVIVWVVFLWMGRLEFRITGRLLKRVEAPLLFSMLDELRDQLTVGGRFEVRLTNEFNAGATATRGLFGLLGTRHVLTLGLPLLAVLTTQQVRAIIAHEFGHLSRRHGRLGHWLYRTRIGWIRYEQSCQHDPSILDRAIGWYSRAFVPYFSTLAFVHSRQCEYEADADAVSVVGLNEYADALATVVSFDALWHDAVPHSLRIQRDTSPTPPKDYLAQITLAARHVSAIEKTKWLDEALQQISSAEDTHPCLSARLSALNAKAQLSELSDIAGQQLLNDAWPRLCQEMNDDWRADIETDWRLQHHYFQQVTRELLEASDIEAVTWPVERALTRARALAGREARGESARGLAALAQLHIDDPQNLDIAAAWVLAYLSSIESSRGKQTQATTKVLALAEAVWKQSPLYRRKIARALRDFYHSSADINQRVNQRDVWQAKLLGVNNARFELMRSVVKAAEAPMNNTEFSALSTDPLPAPIHAFLTASIAADPTITAAWAFAGERTIVTPSNPVGEPLTIHFLALIIDPVAKAAIKIDEETIAAHYEAALARALPLADEIIVITYFSTERQPERFTAENVFIDKRTKVA